MNGSFAAGLFAAVLGLASFAPFAQAAANDTIDGIITGSVNASATPAATDGKGSAAFRAALTLVSTNAAAAYEQARGLGNDTERRTVQWAAIYYGGSAIPYASIARFAADAPGFASSSLYKTRIEQSLIKADAPAADIIALLAGAMPNTVDGQIALASAYLGKGQTDRATAIARNVWVENFLTQAQEKKVLAALGSLLKRDDHWARAVHLMMHDRAAASERLLPMLSQGQKTLVVARAAVSRRDGNAKALLDKVDAAYHSNPVYIFSRAQRARQAELYPSAVDWLNKVSGQDLPDGAEWWYERRTLVRAALAAGQASLAYKAAAGYTHGPEGRLVEANFHAGWIALAFLNDAKTAKTHFEKMRTLSTLPDTLTQADYWLARANLQLGDQAGATAAYQAAAQYGTIYYGLLARAELGIHQVAMRPLPAWQQSESVFNANEVVRAVHLLSANGKNAMAVPLLRHFGTGLTNGGELLLAARLAQQINAHQLAISIADVAEKRGVPLDLFNFPKDGIPANAKVATDRAAVYAIARQESMFQVDAISAVGARGLMQLMPGTAAEVAKKAGVAYSQTRLTSDPSYNALLGSTYLAAQLDRYNGSLVLAAAAYNAGPGNATKWLAAYGDPRASNVDPVIWVELIPFQETRKYVQRVLGNYLVYRERLGTSGITITQALRKIP